MNTSIETGIQNTILSIFWPGIVYLNMWNYIVYFSTFFFTQCRTSLCSVCCTFKSTLHSLYLFYWPAEAKVGLNVIEN